MDLPRKVKCPVCETRQHRAEIDYFDHFELFDGRKEEREFPCANEECSANLKATEHVRVYYEVEVVGV